MAARICESCQLAYPAYGFQVCQVCGEATKFEGNKYVSGDWQKAVTEKRTELAVEEAVKTAEEHKLYTWRYTVLMGAGYSEEDSDILAKTNVDLRRAEDLLANGCDPTTALRILL